MCYYYFISIKSFSDIVALILSIFITVKLVKWLHKIREEDEEEEKRREKYRKYKNVVDSLNNIGKHLDKIQELIRERDATSSADNPKSL